MRIAFLGNFGVDFSSESHHMRSLRALGVEVVPLQEAQTTGQQVLEEAEKSDAFVWVHTHGWGTSGVPMSCVLESLRDSGIPTLTYHLDLWLGLGRQKDMRSDDYWEIGHFFTVDRQMADWLNENTSVAGHYLQPGVFGEECVRAAPTGEQKDVIFVGSRGYHPEWAYRPQLLDWLADTYGGRFSHYGGDGLGVVRGLPLNQLYANTKVVVGDSLCLGFNYPSYWSDRVYETTGRGGFIIHPYVQGMEDHFEDGKHLRFYEFGNFDELRLLIDYYLEHDDEREEIREAGFQHTRDNHTYTHRWDSILQEVRLK